MQPDPTLDLKDTARLAHMLKAARNAIRFAASMDASSLEKDELRAAAVINCFTIICEAAAKLSDQARQLAHEIPWHQIVGMRNNLVHVYWGIDFADVVSTIQNDLPAFIRVVEKVLDEHGRTR